MVRIIDWLLLGLSALGLTIGGYLGLAWAPPETHMGDVYRIMFVHVPAAWVAMLACLVNFVASLVYVFRRSLRADILAEAAAELAVIFCVLLVVTGSLWGKPTWGVWWTWDPRLTTVAIMLISYAGYLALRRFVDVPDKRAMWAAVTGIVIFVDIPIVWYSVRWWNTLHQVQSSPKTMAPGMVIALTFNSLVFVLVFVALMRLRYRVGVVERVEESLPPPDDVGGVSQGAMS